MQENWEAVAEAINTRMGELDLSQQDLAVRSQVSSATLRGIQRNYGTYRPSRRTLAAVSAALNWPREYLGAVADGETPEGGGPLDELRNEVRELRERVERLETGSGRDR
ncbi:helix-turn-helix transcriptional regulator [Sciscionella marina]|uniref:helix-turn-helix transcriptional regulator n=1 Tax=Sciscionella marina TaxID=508770 RepID=UPI0004779D01|nr:helix-turn-helix transcriptional regulator [Sciscionella marina]